MLEYVGRWDLEKSIKWEGCIDDIYYHDTNRLVAVNNKRIKFVNFDQQHDEENKKQEDMLNNGLWVHDLFSKTISPNRSYSHVMRQEAQGTRYSATEEIEYFSLIDRSTGEQVTRLAHTWDIHPGRGFSLDQRYFAFSQRTNDDREHVRIIIYDLQEKKQQELILEDQFVCSLAFSSDNKYIAIGSQKGIASIDITNKNKEIVFLCAKDELITALSYSPCGEYLVAGTKLGAIYQYMRKHDLT